LANDHRDPRAPCLKDVGHAGSVRTQSRFSFSTLANDHRDPRAPCL